MTKKTIDKRGRIQYLISVRAHRFGVYYVNPDGTVVRNGGGMISPTPLMTSFAPGVWMATMQAVERTNRRMSRLVSVMERIANEEG